MHHLSRLALSACVLAGLSKLCSPVLADTGLIARCDRLAGSPFDTHRAGPGVLASQADWPAAVIACRAAVTAHPDNARMHYLLGRALLGNERRPELVKAAALGYGAALASLGYDELNGTAAEAEKGLRDSKAALDAGEPAAAVALGNAFEFGIGVAADLTQAERYYKIAADAGIPDGLNDYAWMLTTRTGRHKEAEVLARRALAIEPRHDSCNDTLAVILLHENQPDKALPFSVTAVSLAPDDASALDHYGDVLARLGRRTEALDQWRRALASTNISPNDITFNRASIEEKLATK